MRRCIWILFALALACTSCKEDAEPLALLRSHVELVREGRCAEARKQLSARTEQALTYLERKPERGHSTVPINEYFCNKFTFEYCRTSEMSLTRMAGDDATVSMPCGRTQDSIFPGFSSIFLKYEPRETHLVREAGEWRVVVPHAIRKFEIREKEDQMVEAYLAQREQRKRERNSPKP
jgi:hypothetical protein